MAIPNEQLWSGYLVWCWNMVFSGYLWTVGLGSWPWFTNRLNHILRALSALWYLIVRRWFSVRRTIILKKFLSPLNHCKVLQFSLCPNSYSTQCVRPPVVVSRSLANTKAIESYKLVCTFTFKLIDSFVVFTKAMTVMACCMKCCILLMKAHLYSGFHFSKWNNFEDFCVAYESCFKASAVIFYKSSLKHQDLM